METQMNKKLLIISIMILIISVVVTITILPDPFLTINENQVETTIPHTQKEKIDPLRIPHYVIIEVDGCEYIGFYVNDQNEITYTHKGNCKNPIHKIQ